MVNASEPGSLISVHVRLQCVMTMEHGAPVEATAWLPGGSLLATAGGTEIRCEILSALQFCCASVYAASVLATLPLCSSRPETAASWAQLPSCYHSPNQ